MMPNLSDYTDEQLDELQQLVRDELAERGLRIRFNANDLIANGIEAMRSAADDGNVEAALYLIANAETLSRLSDGSDTKGDA